MSFEELQKVWQAQNDHVPVVVDANVAMREIRRNHLSLRATIFWRDVREVVVALGLAVWFGWYGWQHQVGIDYGVAAACVFVAAFLLVDRVVQHGKRPATNDSLKGWIGASLHEVDHQIWLLRNVWWWYLLPLALPLGLQECMAIFRAPHLGQLWYAVFCALLFGGVYWLNQYAVRKMLIPRRRELEEWEAGLQK
jgi:hypothetical protein